MEEGALRANVVGGLLIDRNPGPVLVRRCLVAETKAHPGVREDIAWTGGVSLVATPDVTLESSIVAANAGTQLGCWEEGAHAEAANFENHTAKRDAPRRAPRLSSRCALRGRPEPEPVAACPSQRERAKQAASNFYGTLDASENCFWNPARAEVFALHGNSLETVFRQPGVGL